MDISDRAGLGANRPLPEPQWRRFSEQDWPTGFVPLQLELEPSGPVVEVTKPVTVVGRHSTADVRLPLPDVSRHHCRLVFTEGSWEVIDLESLNGVYINGERVDRAVVHDSDKLVIGGFKFAVHLVSDSQSTEEAAHAAPVIKRIGDVLPPQRKAS